MLILRKSYLIFVFSFCTITHAISQGTYNLDSLKKCLTGQLEDTTRVKTLSQLGYGLIRKGDLKGAVTYANQSLELALKINYKKGAGGAYNVLGNIYSEMSNNAKSLEYHRMALVNREEANDLKGMAASYNNIGIVYFNLSDFTKAIEYMQKAMKIQEQFGNKYYVAACIGNIAILYNKLGEDSLALVFQKKSFAIHKELGDKSDMVASLNHLGSLYRSRKEFDKSLEYLKQALEIVSGLDEPKAKAETHGNFGLLYFDMGKYNEAIVEFEKGLAIAKVLDKKLQAEELTMLGNANKALKKDIVAMQYYKDAYAIASEIGSLEDEQKAANGMYLIHKENNNTKEALHYYELLTQLKDSIFSTTKNEAFANLKMQFALDRQEHELKSKADEESKKQEGEKQQQRLISYIIIFILILVSLFSYFLFQRVRITNSQKKIIEEQKVLVEIKNKEVTDSINYAKRIQNAILPAWEIKERIFPDSFIIFHPRDIVSGDFYWFTEKNGKKLIAAVDCTGHGVPGAFMSMIGNAFLNEVVNERGITEPGNILSELRHLVIKALKQTGAGGGQNDGMDISLISISEHAADWAGANNPLWIIRKGELIEYKGDKRPIGYFAGKGLPFKNNTLELQKGDALYLLTDGYADQFGGPKGKKFKYSQLKKLLLSIQDKNMKEQEEVLMTIFKDWQGNLEQVDDVCIVGIRI